MTEFDFHKGLVQVITQLNAAVTNTGFYSPNHPQVARFLERSYDGLTHLLGRREEVTIFLVGDDVVADNEHIPSDGPHIAKFVGLLKKKAIERMTFVSGLAQTELQRLILDLASTDTAAMRSSPHIKLGKVEVRIDASEEEERQTSDELRKLIEASGMDLDQLKELYLTMKRRHQMDVRSIDDAVKEFIKGFGKDITTMNLLAKLKSSQEYSFTHAVNVGMLTMSLAESMGFKGEHLHQIGIAAMLHDIGRLFLPDEIVTRFGKHLHQIEAALMLRDVGKLFIPKEIVGAMRKLTREEFSITQGHTVKGALHLMGLDGIPKLAVLAALEHHVKYDGTGYPSMKAGWKPNLVSQMIAISDMFDAMPNDAQKKSKPMDKIVWVLNRGKGTSFNPQLVDHFLTLIKE